MLEPGKLDKGIAGANTGDMRTTAWPGKGLTLATHIVRWKAQRRYRSDRAEICRSGKQRLRYYSRGGAVGLHRFNGGQLAASMSAQVIQ